MATSDEHGGTEEKQCFVNVDAEQIESELLSEDARQRRSAVQKLADPEQTAPATVRAVCDLLIDLLDDERRVRQPACSALARVSSDPPQTLLDATEQLASLLEDESAVRRNAISTLRGIAAAEPDVILAVVEAIGDRLDDERPIKRHAAAILAAIAEDRPGALAPVHSDLVGALGADDVEVRQFSVRAFAAIASIDPGAITGSVHELLELFTDENAVVRQYATESVAAIVEHEPSQDDEVIEALSTRLLDGGQGAASAVEALNSIATAEPTLCSSIVSHVVEGPSGNATLTRSSAAVLEAIAGIDPAAVQPAITPLVEALDADEKALRASATAALSSVAKADPRAAISAVESLCGRADDDPEIAQNAMQAVETVIRSHPQAGLSLANRLATQLDNDQHSVRSAAARSIAAIATHDAGVVQPVAESLTDHLSTEEHGVREHVTVALAAVLREQPEVDESTVQQLHGTFQDGDSWQQGYAAATLEQLLSVDDERTPAVDRLFDRIDDDRESIRTAASYDIALLGVDHPLILRSSVAELATRLDHEDTTVRTNLTHALAELAEAYPNAVRPVLPSVFDRLHDEDETVRRNVLRTFEALAPDETGHDCRATVEVLGRTLETGDTDQRLAACETLRLIPPASGAESDHVVSGLLRCLEDTHEVRTLAIETLAEIETTFDDMHSPLSVLVAGYCPKDTKQGALARRTLIELAAHAPSVVTEIADDVAELLTSSHENIREAGRRALTRVATETEDGPTPVAMLCNRLRNDETDQPQSYARELVWIAIETPDLVREAAPALVEFLAESEDSRELLVVALCAAGVDVDGPVDFDSAVGRRSDTDNRDTDVTSTFADCIETMSEPLERTASIVVRGAVPSEQRRQDCLEATRERMSDDRLVHRLTAVLGATGLALDTDCGATVVSDLVDHLDDQDPLVGATAARSLSLVAEGTPEEIGRLVPTLREYVADESPVIRQQVIETIATFGNATDQSHDEKVTGSRPEEPESLAELIGARTNDEDHRVRAAAVRALEALSPPAVLPQITALKADPVPEVRQAATEAVRTVQDGADERSTAESDTAVPPQESESEPVHTAWRTPHGDSANGRCSATAAPETAPDSHPLELGTDLVTPIVGTERTVFVGCADDSVRALSGTDASEQWQVSLDATPASGPVLVDDLVVVADDDGRVHAFDADSGESRWCFVVAGRVSSGLTARDSTVVFGTNTGVVCALAASDGTRRFEATIEGGKLHTRPAVTDEHVYVVDERGSVTAFDRQAGTECWQRSLSGWSHTAPVCTGGYVVVTTTDHGVYCLDGQTGQQRWRFDTGGPIALTPATDGERVCVASTDDSIYALDVASGTELWRTTHAAVSGAPVITDDALLIPDSGGTVTAIDIETGGQRWQTGVGNDVDTLAIAGTRYWARTEDELTRIGEEPGSWRRRLSRSVLGSVDSIR